jgi:hypothetical protein
MDSRNIQQMYIPATDRYIRYILSATEPQWDIASLFSAFWFKDRNVVMDPPTPTWINDQILSHEVCYVPLSPYDTRNISCYGLTTTRGALRLLTYFKDSEFEGMNIESMQEAFRTNFELEFGEILTPAGDYAMFLTKKRSKENMIKYIHHPQCKFKYNLNDIIVALSTTDQSDMLQQRLAIIKTIANMQIILDKMQIEPDNLIGEYYVSEDVFINFLVDHLAQDKMPTRDMIETFSDATMNLMINIEKRVTARKKTERKNKDYNDYIQELHIINNRLLAMGVTQDQIHTGRMLLDFPVPSQDSEGKGAVTYMTQEEYDKHIDEIHTKLESIKKNKEEPRTRYDLIRLTEDIQDLDNYQITDSIQGLQKKVLELAIKRADILLQCHLSK